MERMKPRIKSMIWNTRKEKAIRTAEGKRILKNEERLRNLWDILKVPTSKS